LIATTAISDPADAIRRDGTDVWLEICADADKVGAAVLIETDRLGSGAVALGDPLNTDRFGTDARLEDVDIKLV